jgi:4-amino-4-deoxy-L-arabinose transferase-like glycosyltransferase
VNRPPLDRRRWPEAFDLPLLLAVAAVLFFSLAGRAPLWDDDETRFASVAREMLRTGDWVVPRFNGEVADKPPLLFWAMAGSFRFLGETPFAARVPSVLCALATLAVVWSIGRRWHGRGVAAWAFAVLATSLLFAAEAGLATTDSMLLALVSLAMLVAVRAWWSEGGRECPEPRLASGSALLLGAICGLGVLTKGPAALVLPFLSLWVFAWWTRCEGRAHGGGIRTALSCAWPSLAGLRPGLVLAGACAVALPWHVLVFREGGGEWLRIVYLHHYAGRLPWVGEWAGAPMRPVEGHRGFPLFQVAALLGGMFPWSIFLPLAVWRSVRDAVRRGDAAGRFAVVWLFVWLVAVSLSSTQLPHYIFPAFPAAVLMVSLLLAWAVWRPASVADGWLYAAAGGLALGGGGIMAAGMLAAAAGVLPWSAVVLWAGVVPLLSAAVFVVAVRAGRRGVAAGVLLAGAVGLTVVVFFLSVPALGRANALPGLLARADAAASGSGEWVTYRFGLPGVVWHAGRPVKACTSVGEAVGFLRGGAVVVVTAPGYEEIAEALGGRVIVLGRAPLLLRKGEALLVAGAPGDVRGE